VRCMH